MTKHLLVTNDFAPKVGGIQSYLYELWSRLEPSSFSVLTASSDPGAPAFDARWRAEGRSISRLDARTVFLPTRRLRDQIDAEARRVGADLVLLDPAWPLGLVGPSLELPYGVVLHGAEVTIPGRLPIVRSSLRRVLAGAVVAVAAGGYPEREARRVAKEAMPRVIQVPPGVDHERFTPSTPEDRLATRARLGLEPDAEVVVSVVRLVPRKGVDVLIEAAALLMPTHPGLRVVVGGSGRQRAQLERRASKLGVPVQFVGYVPDEDLPGLLGAADVYAAPCRNRWLGLEQEGFGIVYLEAAAAGVAQLAGRSGGADEAVEHGVTGLVVDQPGAPAAVTAALGTLLANASARGQMAEQARHRARRSFDYDLLSRRLAEGLTMGPLRAGGSAEEGLM